MKKYLSLWLLVLAVCLPALAQGPDAQYVSVYNLIKEADALNATGQSRLAFEKYKAAQDDLKRLQTSNPKWNEKAVSFRLSYLEGKLSVLASHANVAARDTNAPITAPIKPVEITGPERQIRELEDQLRQIATERAVLEAKLREALSAQPAAVDPRELTKAEDRIKTLQKENELLKANLDQEHAKSGKAINPALLEQKDKALAEANARLKQDAQAMASLAAEKQTLQDRLQTMKDATPALLAENEKLKKEIVDAQKQLKEAAGKRATQTNRKDRDESSTQRLALNARIAALEAQKIPYTPEELALFKAPVPAAKNPAPTEAKASVATDAAAVKPAKKSVRDLPPGAGSLVAEARRAFEARRYDEAERKYQQVLNMDDKNVFTLANLAAIQMEQNRLPDAETHLKRALAEAPDDAFSLSLFGILKFRQEKFDEALDALSQAAKLDPQNAETQNYLGITLSQKGLRTAAEAALRKAIQLSPGYGSAHYNLAVVYATQKPPFIELARLHYQKAIAAGQPKNPDLDKLLIGAKPASN
jgi:tetratricopeptide (TPR) repeat protein